MGSFLFVDYPSNQYNGHMPKRFLLTLVLILAPLGAVADTVTSPDAPTGLGPQTTTGSSGGSNADSAALQPAGFSPLQSTTSDSTGITAPSSVLQAPATGSDALTVLSGEADGAPQGSPDDSNGFPWTWLIFTLIIGLAVAATGIVLRDRRRFRHTIQE
jgi:hypothetical protein